LKKAAFGQEAEWISHATVQLGSSYEHVMRYIEELQNCIVSDVHTLGSALHTKSLHLSCDTCVVAVKRDISVVYSM